jgi:hypothetical protein
MGVENGVGSQLAHDEDNVAIFQAPGRHGSFSEVAGGLDLLGTGRKAALGPLHSLQIPT